MALERAGIRVGIELVVHFEERTRRNQGMCRSAEVPGLPAEKIAALHHIDLQRGGIREDGPLNAVIQNFANAKWHGHFRRGGPAQGYCPAGRAGSSLLRGWKGARGRHDEEHAASDKNTSGGAEPD